MTAAPGLSDAQVNSIAEADGSINLWEGSVRSGKTVGSLLRWLGHIEEQRGKLGEVFCFGRTRETLARNVFGPLASPQITGPLARHVKYTPGAATAQVLGETVHVIGVNDRTAEQKARGLTGKSGYGDELTVIGEDFFTQALARMSVENSKIFGTTNPGPPAHWLKRNFIDRADDVDLDLRTWHFTLDDNPFIPDVRKRQIKASHTGLFYRRFILGEWVAAEGAIFDMWDEDRHVISGDPPVRRYLCTGVDYGTSNAFAALTLVELVDGRLCLLREYRHDPRHHQGRKLTDVEFSRALRAYLADMPAHMVAIDPSAASFKEQLRQDKVTRVQDADNAVVDSIRLTASLLASDRLVVHESCTGLISEAPGYSWDDKAAEKGEDKPIKTADHSIDAGFRYAPYTSRHMWKSDGPSMKRPRATRVPSATVGPYRR